LYSITFGMSRGIVSQRPFSQKKRRQSFRKMLNRSGVSIPEFQISKKFKNILSRWAWFTVLIIVWVLILIKLLFFQPSQIISQVKFSSATEATFKDSYLFDFIVNEVKWKNYYVLKSNKSELLSKIQKWFKVKNPAWEFVEFKFPFVWDIELQLEPVQEEIIEEEKPIIVGVKFPTLNWTWTQQWSWIQLVHAQFPLKSSQKAPENWWTLWVQLLYYEPTVLIQINDKKYAVWNEETYVEMKEWMLLWIRVPTEDDPNPEQLLTIETPQYLTWTSSLDWFFFEISLPEFLQIAKLAKEEFWHNMLRFVYLAGSTRFAIFTSDQKTLYFNFPDGWNIEDQWNSQIFKYNTLREKYDKFWNIDKIDLWSLENNKTIIQNY
jgi:hypothetical protein